MRCRCRNRARAGTDALGQECLGSESTTWCASLRRGRDDWEQLFDCVMTLHTLGVPIDMAGLEAGQPRRRLSLPTLPVSARALLV